MAEVYDHLSDDGLVSLCGLTEDELPSLPLCPVCLGVEARTRPAPGELRTGGFVHAREHAR